jgi:hypothetical protein
MLSPSLPLWRKKLRRCSRKVFGVTGVEGVEGAKIHGIRPVTGVEGANIHGFRHTQLESEVVSGNAMRIFESPRGSSSRGHGKRRCWALALRTRPVLPTLEDVVEIPQFHKLTVDREVNWLLDDGWTPAGGNNFAVVGFTEGEAQLAFVETDDGHGDLARIHTDQ